MDQAAFYDELITKYGPTPAAVDYTETGQLDRLRAIERVILYTPDGVPSHYSILDVGCGYGAFAEYLAKSGWWRFDYHGIDISSGMIDAAHRQSLLVPVSFTQCDLFDCNAVCDYVVCSGAFNMAVEDNLGLLARVLAKMWSLCKVGMAISLTSNSAEKPDPKICHYHPADVVSRIPHGARRCWKLDHSYRRNDMCLYAWRVTED